MQLQSNLFLLLAAIIWGFAFVAQRVGLDYLGPFTFNGIRFALGSLSLLPLIMIFHLKSKTPTNQNLLSAKKTLLVGIIAGTILFAGASLQTVGLIYTTAGKAAFITCLYIVLVPLFGIFLKHRINQATWSGCFLAAVGLYLLCVKGSFTLCYGDILQLIGALFWTGHIIFIDYYAIKVDSLKLACFQFATCSVLSILVALCLEPITYETIKQAAVPLLYGGFGSVGIAFTLQIIGQKHSPPSHAAVILSMETVFGAIGGYLLLDEILSGKEMIGCILMLSGMLITQLKPHTKQSHAEINEIAG